MDRPRAGFLCKQKMVSKWRPPGQSGRALRLILGAFGASSVREAAGRVPELRGRRDDSLTPQTIGRSTELATNSAANRARLRRPARMMDWGLGAAFSRTAMALLKETVPLSAAKNVQGGCVPTQMEHNICCRSLFGVSLIREGAACKHATTITRGQVFVAHQTRSLLSARADARELDLEPGGTGERVVGWPSSFEQSRRRRVSPGARHQDAHWQPDTSRRRH